MNKHNTIGKGSIQRAVNGGIDKYYTKSFIAKYYSEIVKELYPNSSYIEPSAGNGVFIDAIGDHIVGYDISPDRDDIIKMDWFDVDESIIKDKVIIGNPPFGMSASIAIKFFNHAAKYKAKVIAFVLPRTFKKISTHNKLDLNYKLVFEQDIISNAFILDNIEYDVPCVFQIWEISKEKRLIENTIDCKWIEFTDKESADVAVRRAGGRAGQLLDGTNHTESSTYFLKIKNANVLTAIKLIDISKYIDNTAGVKSISKLELCKEINRIMEIINV
jgi:hypothetical protein